MCPVLILTVLPVVALTSISIVLHVEVRVSHFLEVLWLKVVARVLLAPFTRSTLLFLKAVLLSRSQVSISSLKCTLIRPESRVSPG